MDTGPLFQAASDDDVVQELGRAGFDVVGVPGVYSPLPRRAARSTTRIASTPAAMAAASGSRDGSGPINGTGAGPATGLGALATADFAFAAAYFAADVRTPLVPASFAAVGAFLGGAFFAAALLAAFFAGAFLAGLAGGFLAALARALLAGLAGGFLAGGTGGSAAGGTGCGLGAGGVSSAAGAAASGFSSGRSCWSAMWLLLCACLVLRLSRVSVCTRQLSPSCQVG